MATLSQLLNHVHRQSQSNNGIDRYCYSRLSSFVTLPVEMTTLISEIFHFLGSSGETVLKGPVKFLRVIAPRSESLQIWDNSLSGPREMWESIKKIGALIVGILVSLPLSIISPSWNYALHVKLGLVEAPEVPQATETIPPPPALTEENHEPEAPQVVEEETLPAVKIPELTLSRPLKKKHSHKRISRADSARIAAEVQNRSKTKKKKKVTVQEPPKETVEEKPAEASPVVAVTHHTDEDIEENNPTPAAVPPGLELTKSKKKEKRLSRVFSGLHLSHR